MATRLIVSRFLESLPIAHNYKRGKSDQYLTTKEKGPNNNNNKEEKKISPVLNHKRKGKSGWTKSWHAFQPPRDVSHRQVSVSTSYNY
jgi:hypothetical protein